MGGRGRSRQGKGETARRDDEGEEGVGGSSPSSASSSSSTPVSWHFLLWAFDFMCLVRFPGKKEGTQARLQGRGQRRPGAHRRSAWLAGCGFEDPSGPRWLQGLGRGPDVPAPRCSGWKEPHSYVQDGTQELGEGGEGAGRRQRV